LMGGGVDLDGVFRDVGVSHTAASEWKQRCSFFTAAGWQPFPSHNPLVTTCGMCGCELS
jgi:hypothetical protein